MKNILITLTLTLATLTVASALVSKSSSSVLDGTVIVAGNPPPLCPPICSDASTIVVHKP